MQGLCLLFRVDLTSALLFGIVPKRVLQDWTQLCLKTTQADAVQILTRTLNELENVFAPQAFAMAGCQAHTQAGCAFDLLGPLLKRRRFFTARNSRFDFIPVGDQYFHTLAGLLDDFQRVHVGGGGATGAQQIEHRVGLANLGQGVFAMVGRGAAQSGQVDDRDALQPGLRKSQHRARGPLRGMRSDVGKLCFIQWQLTAILTDQGHAPVGGIFNKGGQGCGFFERGLQQGLLQQHV